MESAGGGKVKKFKVLTEFAALGLGALMVSSVSDGTIPATNTGHASQPTTIERSDDSFEIARRSRGRTTPRANKSAAERRQKARARTKGVRSKSR